jgi:hypothetical protein
MKRSDVLDIAKHTVVKREEEYGDAGDVIRHIADLWMAYLDRPILATDVCNMMVLLKIARAHSSPTLNDHWIDMAGYAALGGEIGEARDEQ